jgi:hypothetical protein
MLLSGGLSSRGGTDLPLILYSTITQLAYLLGARYYNDVHYVWCAPCPPPDRHGRSNPASSHPIKLYERYAEDVRSGERHSALIDQNKIGLIKGAEARFREKFIDAQTRDHIIAMINAADHNEFSPLLLAIPFAGVKKIVERAPVHSTARPTSEEFIIRNLPRRKFDVLRFEEASK